MVEHVGRLLDTVPLADHRGAVVAKLVRVPTPAITVLHSQTLLLSLLGYWTLDACNAFGQRWLVHHDDLLKAVVLLGAMLGVEWGDG